MIRLHNNSQRRYMHQLKDLSIVVLEPNEIKDIPDEVAEIWQKSNEIKVVGAAMDEVEGLKARIKQLEAAGVEIPKEEKLVSGQVGCEDAKTEKKKAGRKPKAEAKKEAKEEKPVEVQADIEEVIEEIAE